jgi:predicted dehydrogenase
MLRAAAIGLGWWADELTQAIQGTSRKIRVTACYSRSAETRARVSRRHGAAVSIGGGLADAA